ncbi:Hypothetical protein CINCED_3A013343 [Cinara cedri]|uniref:Uncharacterized protein n=1 Tax=Cinara cedri TaxID=506608 RepID=A0A5E4MWV5_9HEMI|nr:Hypothetical protein CINCED_3A013343 [Cinara cedri]
MFMNFPKQPTTSLEQPGMHMNFPNQPTPNLEQPGMQMNFSNQGATIIKQPGMHMNFPNQPTPNLEQPGMQINFSNQGATNLEQPGMHINFPIQTTTNLEKPGMQMNFHNQGTPNLEQPGMQMNFSNQGVFNLPATSLERPGMHMNSSNQPTTNLENPGMQKNFLNQGNMYYSMPVLNVHQGRLNFPVSHVTSNQIFNGIPEDLAAQNSRYEIVWNPSLQEPQKKPTQNRKSQFKSRRLQQQPTDNIQPQPESRTHAFGLVNSIIDLNFGFDQIDAIHILLGTRTRFAIVPVSQKKPNGMFCNLQIPMQNTSATKFLPLNFKLNSNNIQHESMHLLQQGAKHNSINDKTTNPTPLSIGEDIHLYWTGNACIPTGKLQVTKSNI